jgi:hypothetical protein
METTSIQNTENPTVIDLSASALVKKYLRFWRRVLSVVLLIGLLGLFRHRSAFWLVLLAVSGLAYFIVRNPTRLSMRCWTWLWMFAAPSISVWLLWELVWVLRDEFAFGIVVPFADICLFFWVCTRVLRESPATDQEPSTDPSQLFASGPSFADRWLSGGWRTVFILTMIWVLSFDTGPWSFVLYTPGIGLGCVLFGLAVAGVMVLPWALVPVSQALRNESSMSLLRAIVRNRAKAQYGSYTSFLLRQVPKRPSAIPWLAGSVLLFLGAILIFPTLAGRLPNGSQPYQEFSNQQFLEETTQRLRGATTVTLVSLSLFCWRRGRQQVLRGSLKQDLGGKQPSTLYLRSFFDDQIKILRDGLRYRVWFTDPFLQNIRFTRFEEVVTEAIWPFGGVIGLARPGEKLPELGAARIAADDGDWKQKIDRLMDESERILMVVGVTSGLKWEFQQSRDKARFAKLSLVIPPGGASSIATSWRNLVSDLPQLLHCEEVAVGRTLAVRFRDDASPVFLSADQRSVAAYELALDACWLPLDRLLEVARNGKTKSKGSAGSTR